MKNQWYYKNSVLKYRFYEKHSFREKKKKSLIKKCETVIKRNQKKIG